MNRRFVQDKQNKLTVQDIIKVLESQVDYSVANIF